MTPPTTEPLTIAVVLRCYRCGADPVECGHGLECAEDIGLIDEGILDMLATMAAEMSGADEPSRQQRLFLVSHVRTLIALVRSGERVIEMALETLKEKPPRAVCAHCQSERDVESGAMAAHVRTCERNPMVAEMADLRTALAIAAQEYRTSYDTVRASLEAVAKERDEARADLRAHREALDMCKEERAVFQAAVADLMPKLTDAEPARAAAQRGYDDLHAMLDPVVGRMDTWTQVDTLIKARAAAEKERDEAREDVQRLSLRLSAACDWLDGAGRVVADLREAHYCQGCKQEIDPECCGCGDGPLASHDGHFFIPMGCDCFRVKDDPQSPVGDF
jgi:predicted  nucleic acid-binding Zn-ribbon protein